MAYKRTSMPKSRWMTLRYAGKSCKVCGTAIPEGANAFWDAGTRLVTCYSIDCCEADGLTESKWVGSPVSGQFVPSRTAVRVGRPYSEVSA